MTEEKKPESASETLEQTPLSLPVILRIGDLVRGKGRYAHYKGKIIGINSDNGAVGIKLSSGAIMALYKHEVEKV